MQTSPTTPADAGDTLPEAPTLHVWHHTGDGVVFFDTEHRRRVRAARASSRRLYLTAVAVVLGILALGLTVAISFDWWSPDSMVTFTTSR
jgi:hypothetical protein